MASTNCFPKNLAEALHSELELRGSHSPGIEILTDLFETLYFVSLKTEELQPITCYIVYLSPENPAPKPPGRIVKDRWSYIRFIEPILFTASNLVKLAKASDPRTSSFAVYHDTHGHLSIWGIIDQANRYHDFINYDGDEGMDRPGMFQASIIGIGHLVTYIGYEKIAELKTNVLLGKTLDVLGSGSVYEALTTGILGYIETVQGEVAENERATKSRLLKVDYNHFGTRHRSMMRYCSQVPGSIGFVISQDGDVRAMTQVHNQLVMWENIKLQRDFKRRSRRRKHTKGSQEPNTAPNT